jgi:hypothetical protein
LETLAWATVANVQAEEFIPSEFKSIFFWVMLIALAIDVKGVERVLFIFGEILILLLPCRTSKKQYTP